MTHSEANPHAHSNHEVVKVSWVPQISGLTNSYRILYLGFQPKLNTIVVVFKRNKKHFCYSGQPGQTLTLTPFEQGYEDKTNQKFRLQLAQGELVYCIGRPSNNSLKNLALEQFKPTIKEPST